MCFIRDQLKQNCSLFHFIETRLSCDKKYLLTSLSHSLSFLCSIFKIPEPKFSILVLSSFHCLTSFDFCFRKTVQTAHILLLFDFHLRFVRFPSHYPAFTAQRLVFLLLTFLFSKKKSKWWAQCGRPLELLLLSVLSFSSSFPFSNISV